MLAAIGETFDPAFVQAEAARQSHTGMSASSSSLITGVIVTSRPQFFRISVWTRSTPTHTFFSTSNGQLRGSTSIGSSPEDGDALRDRIEAIGKYFKTNVLGYGETLKLRGPLVSEVEYMSHRVSESLRTTK